jgi:hypothetical protein
MNSEIREPPQETPPPEGPRPLPSTSSDDLILPLTELPPDPFLGEFVEGASPQPAIEPGPVSPGVEPPGSFDAVAGPELSSSGPSVLDPAPAGTSEIQSALHLAPSEAPAPEAPTVPSAGSFDALGAPAIPPTMVAEREPASGSAVVSSDTFPALDLSAPPPARPETGKTSEREAEEEEEEEDLPPRGTPWLTVLLASVNSALILFLIWHFYKEHRTPREVAEPSPIPPATAAEESADPGRRADQSQRLAVRPGIDDDYLTTLGQPLRVGALEVTPMAVTSGPVTLQRVVMSSERRKTGKEALKLRLRLRNVSYDAAFFPLDEVFIRERERGGSDSFIERPRGFPIDMYPLAVASEWSIVGQEFRKLTPGKSYETVVVAAPYAPEPKSPEMTWRVRLRTGIERTDVVGVRFHDSEIRPEPEPKEKPRDDGKRPLND